MHDEHFLTRLDRLDAAQAEDALALYYDATLVQQVLAHTKERGHGDRIAISLDDPREGPFVVVTQGGDFVTALGRGMSVGDLPVVPRALWAAARRDHERLRDAFARADEASRGNHTKIRKELAAGGQFVSREVMSVMIMIAKVAPIGILRSWTGAACDVSEALKMIRTRDTWHRLGDDFFDAAGRALWQLGHFSVLVGANTAKELAPTDPLRAQIAGLRPSLYCSRLGVIGPLVRTLWVTGKLGPLFFAQQKQHFRTAPGREYAMDAAMSLAVIANRFSKYRGEAKKVLTIAERPDETPHELIRRFWGTVGNAALTIPREVLRETLVDYGRGFWVNGREHTTPDHPLHFATREAVPDEIALATFALGATDLWAADRYDVMMAAYAPATCLLEAEELYLPKRYIGELGGGFDFVDSTKAAFARQRAERAPKPLVAAPKVGRNDPCPCASGKKWKRCCGAAADAPEA